MGPLYRPARPCAPGMEAMSFEWKHDEWSHELRLADGRVLHPTRMVMDSAARNTEGKVFPAVFCQIGAGPATLLWIVWDEVKSLKSTRKT